MILSCHELARLIDLSAVRAECDEDEIRELAATARRFGVGNGILEDCTARPGGGVSVS